MTTNELKAKCAELERERDAAYKTSAQYFEANNKIKGDCWKLKDSLTAAEQRVASLEGAIKQADEMHLGRCASSEPFKAIDYRNHACDARDILRDALRTPSGEKGEATI